MQNKRKKGPLICEELEPRILFSAGGLDSPSHSNDLNVGFATERLLGSEDLESIGILKQEQPVKQSLNVLVGHDEALVNPASPNIEETSGVNRGSHRAVAIDAAGNTVVVWSDSARDGSGFGVYAQRFDASGNKLGSEIQVNTTSFTDQRRATIDMDASGRFAVVFTGNDGDSEGVYLRRFNADGSAIDTADIEVNTGLTAGSQFNPSVALNASGQMVIAWQSDGANEGIYSRHFDMTSSAPGNQLGTPLITVETTASADEPMADINDSGRIIIAWSQSGDLLGRRYDHNNSVALSSRHDLNLASSSEHSVSVAIQSDGDFAIAYRSDVFLFNGLWARHFNADGSAKGLAQRFDSTGQNPVISSGTDDSYITVFEDDDSSGTGVFAQKFNSSLSQQGGGFQINTSTALEQSQASVAVHDIDNFAVVWSGNGTQAGEVDGNGVFKRQFGTAVSNVAPNATNLSASETYTEDTPLNLTDIEVSDVDNSNTAVSLTLSDVAAGSLSTGSSGSVTSSYNAGTGVWQASGAITDVNTLLRTLIFTPSLNYDTDFSIATSVDDGIAAPLTGTKLFTATPVNDAPLASNLSAAEAYTEETPLNLADIVISDVDNSNTRVTLTLSDITAGSLSTGSSGSVTSTYNAGTGVWQATGAIADVNTLLQALTFNPALNYDSNFTIATSVDDSTSPPITGSKVFTATAINDAPLATNLNTGETYTEDTALDLTDIVVSDTDNANTTVTLTLSDSKAGILSTDTSGSVTSTFNPSSGVWQASGAIAEVNALLQTVVFTPNLNYNSDFNIATQVDDGTATPLTGSKPFNAIAVNDDPVASVFLPVSINEGESLSLDGSGSSDVDGSIEDYEWDIGSDGSFEVSTPNAIHSWTWEELKALGIDDDDDYQFTLRVRDDGGATNTQSFIVTVRDTAPTITLSGDTEVTVNDIYTLSVTSSDPGDDSISNLLIDWGDGTIESFAVDSGSFDHTYTSEDSNRTIVVTASEGPLSFPAVQLNVTVSANNQPGGDISINLGAGEAVVGNTLSVTNTLFDLDGISSSINYQWQRNGIDIAGANSESYLLVAEDAGAAISVVASYVDDLGNPESVSSSISIAVEAANQTPQLSLDQSSATIQENADISSRIKLSDLTVEDDGLGSNTLTLSGVHASFFEIIDDVLYLKAGVALDYESAAQLEVTVSVDDPTLGTTPDDSKVFTLFVEDVVEAIDEADPIVPPPPNEPLINENNSALQTDTPSSTFDSEPAVESDTEQASPENTPSEALERLPGAGGASSFSEDQALNIETPGIHDALSDQLISGTFVEREVNGVTQQRANSVLLSQLEEINFDELTLQNTQIVLDDLAAIDPMAAYSILENSAFVESLDLARSNMQMIDADKQIVIGSSVLASSSLSIGYVLWLLRGSVLLSTLLSSMPAWRVIDPLPILAGALEDDDEDDESLQSMLEQEPDDEEVKDPHDNDSDRQTPAV